MATKADLEAREADCNNAEDLSNLATECLQDPVDLDYAKELLTNAESQCQFPVDSIRIAELYAVEPLNDKAKAEELYGDAENACFESHEFAEVGASIGKFLGDTEKGKQLIEQAAADAKNKAEFVRLAQYAEKMGDSELAQSYFDKVLDDCKSVADYKELAEGVVKENINTAKDLYKKAERYAADIDSAIEYAQGATDLFNDNDWANEILASVEGDCQFPQEFVSLAKGYKSVVNNEDKVRELLDEGGNFAMAEDEFQALADGYWGLLQDKDKAAAAYDKVVAELNDRGKLLDLAKVLATEIEDKDRAKTVYAKVESKTASALDLGKLAQAVCDDLGDKDYAAEIYDRAAGNMTGANDFINLAGEVVKNLGDNDKGAGLYRQAIDNTSDFNGFIKVLDAVENKLPEDKNLAGDIVAKLEGLADNTGEHLSTAERINKTLGDADKAKARIKMAEEGVSSLDEMKKVVTTIKANFTDDADWIAQVEEKLSQREANQVKYITFQKREAECKTARQNIALVDDVMAELADKSYGEKLLRTAETLMNEQAFDFNLNREFAVAVDKHLQDQNWVKNIFDACAAQADNFAMINLIGNSVAKLSDKAFGQGLAKDYYENYLNSLENGNAYDYGKVTSAVVADLGDTDWGKQLLDQAAAAATGHQELAYAANLAVNALGDESLAAELYQKAIAGCDNASQLEQIANSLRNDRINSEQTQSLYEQGLEKLTGDQRLRGIESIMSVFNNREWASSAYDKAADSFTGDDKLRFSRSRRSSLDNHLSRPA